MIKYKRNTEVLSAELDKEICLFSKENAQYINLNSTSSTIWSIISTPSTLDSIVSKLIDIYSVDKIICERETLFHLNQLINLKIVKACHQNESD